MTCRLCGAENYQVSIGLVEWVEPVEGQRFSSVPRCEDRAACRKRVEASGEEWEAA